MPQAPLRRIAKLAVNRYGLRTQLVRRLVFDRMSQWSDVIGVTGPGGTFLVPPNDTLGRATFVARGFQEETMQRALALLNLQPGGHVVDVGGNIGTTTISALNRFGFDTATTIEPEPRNLRFLRANLAINDLTDRVDLHPVAVSAEPGELELEMSPTNLGDFRIRQTAEEGVWAEQAWPTVTVPVTTLDSLAVPSETRLLWIDVQGHEGHVLAGASELLTRGLPAVTEFWPYALRRAGGYDLYRTIVAERFSHAVDLTTGERSPASELESFADKYPEMDHSDLLLLP